MDTKNLKARLSFDKSATFDDIGNIWTAHGNPTISAANAYRGAALQLNGANYIQSGEIELGGQDFTVDGWCYTDANCAAGARVFNIHLSPNTGNSLVALRHPYEGSGKWRLVTNSTAAVGSNSNIQDSGVDPTGELHHFAVVYRRAAKTMTFFVDGVQKAQQTNCPQFTRKKFIVDIGTQIHSSSEAYYFTGAVDEFRIYDGVALWVENFTPPTVDSYSQISFTVDLERRIKNAALTWRYENFGTADLLSSSGTTLTNLPENQSKTGTAFYQTTRAKCFDIPATKEIWLKFDVYTNLSNRWRAYNDNSNGINGICSQTSGQFDFWINGTQTKTFAGAIKNQLQNVLLHMISDNSSGVVEAWLDGEKIYTYTGNVNNGEDFADIYLQSDGAGTFFSNVIISNAEIFLGEGYHKINFDLRRNLLAAVNFTVDLERALTQSNVLTVEENADGHFCQKFFEGDEWGNQPYGETLVAVDNVVSRIDFPARNEIWLCFSCYVEGRPDDAASNPLYKVFCGDEEHASGFAAGKSIDYENLLIDGVSSAMKYGYDWSDAYGYYVHFLLHLRSGVTDGLVEVQFHPWMFEDDESSPVYSATGNVNNGEPLTNIFMLLCNGAEYSDRPAEAWGIVVSDRVIDIRGNFLPGTAQTFNFDLERKIVRAVKFNCDLERRLPHKLIITPIEPPTRVKKMLRAAAASLPETEGVQSITITLAAQQLTDQLSFAWINPAEIMEQVRGQYLDYKFDMRIEETTQNGILTTCQCCSDIDELLYTQTSYTLGRGVFQGGLYYDKSKYILPGDSAKAAADARHEAIKKAHSAASAHIMKMAEFLGKQVVLAYDDFVSTIDTDEGGVTYGDLIRDIFGWTSRLPQMLINCYIRNDTLYVIQRGYESNVIDLSATKHTVPVINKKIMRTTWGSTPGAETVIDRGMSTELGDKISDEPDEIDEPDNPDKPDDESGDDEPKTEDWAFCNNTEEIDTPAAHTTITRTYGADWVLLSIQEITESKIDNATSEKTTNYSYSSFGFEGQHFITETTEEYIEINEGEVVASTRTVKKNKYGFIQNGEKLERAILTAEASSVFDYLEGKYVDYSFVTHAFLAQGQRVIQATKSDGTSGSTTTATPYTDELTPFEKQKNADAGLSAMQNDNKDDDEDRYSGWYTYENGEKREVTGFKGYETEFTVEGIYLYDSSFPVEGNSKLKELTDAIKWLNRKTQETITMEIYDYQHVIDFNDRIIFNGNEYFLENNTVEKTPRIVNKQTVQFVRWY